MTPITETLQAVASLIEATYDHDEDGNRTNMYSPMSGADIAAELFNMEGAVFDVLAESKAMPDLLGALQSLVDDLTDADEDHNPETGTVYSSVANAREVLDRVNAAIEEPRGIKVEITVSEQDGTPVVQIDTPDLPEDTSGPKIRVYLNDGTLYENPPYPKDQ